MKTLYVLTPIFLLSLCAGSGAQTQTAPSIVPDTSFAVTYPEDRAGIFVQTSSWEELKDETPSKTKAKHGIAASLSYGAVPAKVVAEYEGEHAASRVQSGPVTICICHLLSLPGEPVLVKLHPKKGARELDGGKMIVYPVVGGAKTADANKTDLMAVDVAHPDPHVWLIRSQSPLKIGRAHV